MSLTLFAICYCSFLLGVVAGFFLCALLASNKGGRS
jgi:hypothetical protein